VTPPLGTRFKRLKTLPVFPTLLTSGNLACGLTAILCAAHYDAQHKDMLWFGAVMIFVAMVCDMFDGKVARMTRTAGPFGAELDSLADVVSFGVAPAILMHRLVLGEPGVFAYGVRLMWFITVFYPVLAAIRLARYNVEHSDEATPWFRGLPSPGAAALVSAWVIMHEWLVANPEDAITRWCIAHGVINPAPWTGLGSMDAFRWGLVVVTVIAALLMVSTVRYPHVGNTLFGRISFRSFILILFLIVLLVMVPIPVVLFVGTTGYVGWGLLRGCYELWRNWRQGRNVLEDEDEATADDVGEGDRKPEDVGPAHGR
jgi:CDP-diacylglycerol--serine O-phosphatidyltransferase